MSGAELRAVVDRVLWVLENTPVTMDDLLSREEQAVLRAKLQEASRLASSREAKAFKAGWDAHTIGLPVGAYNTALAAYLAGGAS